MPVQAAVMTLGFLTVPQEIKAGGTGERRVPGFQVILLIFSLVKINFFPTVA